MANNYYCASPHCRRTTQRLRVEMARKTYYYCVECGRRLERRTQQGEPARAPHGTSSTSATPR